MRGVLSGWARLPLSEVIFGLAVGVVLSTALVVSLPSVRTHM